MSFCGGWGGGVGGVGWSLQNHFHVQPKHCVEVVLRCVVVGAVTIILSLMLTCWLFDMKNNTLVIQTPAVFEMVLWSM